MKSAIIWYSYSGNTKKVAEELSSSLAKKGEVTQVELVALDEPNNFFAQCQRAF
jgi:flavodoxin